MAADRTFDADALMTCIADREAQAGIPPKTMRGVNASLIGISTGIETSSNVSSAENDVREVQTVLHRRSDVDRRIRADDDHVRRRALARGGSVRPRQVPAQGADCNPARRSV